MFASPWLVEGGGKAGSVLKKVSQSHQGEEGSEQRAAYFLVSAPWTLGLRLTPPVITCVAWGKLLNLSVLPFRYV